MRNARYFVAMAIVLAAVGSMNFVVGQSSGYRISSSHIYKNLTVFLIHGKNETLKTNIIALPEAMERKILKVYETSEVNELEVENISKTLDVFIQSGDIVKGGKQDRVLAVSIIIPANSGRVKIDAFCVESGRWQKRNNENVGEFSSANDRIVSKDLKMAANSTRSQQEVWSKVSDAQKRLSDNVGSPVAAKESRSSLQLSLENTKVAASADEYIKNLLSVANGKSDVIGYAIAINGQINSADIYVSNDLFKKVWPRMLKAAAVEAVAESRAVRLADPVKVETVKAFLDDADKGKSKERAVAGQASVITREKDDNAVFEARDERSKIIVHRNYVKKN